jgi:hypothetical protein
MEVAKALEHKAMLLLMHLQLRRRLEAAAKHWRVTLLPLTAASTTTSTATTAAAAAAAMSTSSTTASTGRALRELMQCASVTAHIVAAAAAQ